MSWIDDVYTTLNKTMDLAKAAREEQARQEGVKAGQKSIINQVLGITTPNDWKDDLLTGEWFDEETEEVHEGRSIYAPEENPGMSMNRDIPRTDLVQKIQSGQYKLASDTNNTYLNNDAALFIVGNTYQSNPDGINYGMGWDGRPYSYTVSNGIVGNFTPLDDGEQRSAISRLTNGRVTVDSSITNDSSLASIYRSLDRMKRYDGNLDTGYVNIYDASPEDYSREDPQGRYSNVRGLTYWGAGTKEDPIYIDLVGTNYPWYNKSLATDSGTKGETYPWWPQYGNAWSTSSSIDEVVQHELAHAVNNYLYAQPYNYYNNVLREAENYDDKYTVETLKWQMANAVQDLIKYIPALIGQQLGYNTVPDFKEIEALMNKDELTEEEQGKLNFWMDYFYEPKFSPQGAYMRSRAARFVRRTDKEIDEAFNNLLKSAGFDADGLFNGVAEAARGVSGYAQSANNRAELIAEAVADTLINGRRASPFSRKLTAALSDIVSGVQDMVAKEEAEVLRNNYSSPASGSLINNLDLLPQYGGKQNDNDFLNQVKSLNIK